MDNLPWAEHEARHWRGTFIWASVICDFSVPGAQKCWLDSDVCLRAKEACPRTCDINEQFSRIYGQVPTPGCSQYSPLAWPGRRKNLSSWTMASFLRLCCLSQPSPFPKKMPRIQSVVLISHLRHFFLVSRARNLSFTKSPFLFLLSQNKNKTTSRCVLFPSGCREAQRQSWEQSVRMFPFRP